MHNTPNVVTHIGNRKFSSYYVGILDRFRRKIITSKEADAPINVSQVGVSTVYTGLVRNIPLPQTNSNRYSAKFKTFWT
jgi:hypothetical protein